MRILKEESAGLVIDIQERLYPHIHQHEALLSRVEILLEGWRILEIPVLATEQYKKGLGETLEAVRTRIPAWHPVEKKAFSCCDEPGFAAALARSGKTNVIICGIETHVCVLQTTLDLLNTGYQPVVVTDAVSSRFPADKEVALGRMQQEGVILATVESVLFELARVSGTDAFKAISNLVK